MGETMMNSIYVVVAGALVDLEKVKAFIPDDSGIKVTYLNDPKDDYIYCSFPANEMDKLMKTLREIREL